MWYIIMAAVVASTMTAAATAAASQTTRFLITGCSRGIGLGLVEHLLSVPDNMVVATCRSPAESTGLQRLQQSYAKDRLLVLPLDTTSLEGHQTLVKCLSAEHGIDSVDVFIANAGISSPNHPIDPILTCPSEVMMNVFRTNCVGTMFGLQCFSPLLLRSPSRIVVLLSSRLASIEQTAGVGGYTAYRTSKAAVNMLAMTWSEEATIKEAGVVTLCMHPGWVQTDMGGSGGRKAPVSIVDSARGIHSQILKAMSIRQKMQLDSETMAKVIDDPLEQALRKNRCVFTGYDGEILPW